MQQPRPATSKPWIFIAAILVVTTFDTTSALAESFPIAGVDPANRPTGAPAITEVQKDAAWYQQALTGISEPYPGSLRFLEDQGSWFTPFNRPGMPPPYDIRGWHDRTSPDAGELTQ